VSVEKSVQAQGPKEIAYGTPGALKERSGARREKKGARCMHAVAGHWSSFGASHAAMHALTRMAGGKEADPETSLT
jgi:hypothetical protein